ncbi:MAG: L-aspartate oxidase [Thermodesulfovibrionales bacterium]|nr:L-aspartate oxidase [Thermodesulfovibrionales bacterium]
MSFPLVGNPSEEGCWTSQHDKKYSDVFRKHRHMETETVDLLIIGSGVAGLRAAIELAPYGNVLVVTKDMPKESSTEYAQGGIAVALSDEDKVGIHFEDTLKAGDGLCNENAVKILVEEGPRRILELISWGAEFDKEGTRLDFTIEGAHSRKRVLHAHGDSTGKELERVLLNKTRSFPSVKKYPFAFTVDLIVIDNECYGAYVLKERKICAILAKATILCTGGAGQIFSRTTNPLVATGDGMAIAFRAGAQLEDMEFIQFHPTSLYSPYAPQFLLSEAMRGEGAILKNVNKEPFMKDYHPNAELAPRDIVSRAIISEMVKTNSSHVYLDMMHLNSEFLRKRFPQIYSTCLQYNVDITSNLIPVSPAAHYIMGGVRTGVNGATSIKRLYAAGESACTGVHGANRLASNSLLEGLVYGARTGSAAYQSSSDIKNPAAVKEHVSEYTAAYHSIPEHDEIRMTLRKLMWDRVGIIRCADSLEKAKSKLSEWSFMLDKMFFTRRELELKNMLTVAMMITEAASLRKGSAGAHYRSDFPQKGKDWQKHIALAREDDRIKYSLE